jgi:small neutral amino acid transporter SnatA (MarC family)
MLKTALSVVGRPRLAFATFFATIGPVEAAVLFATFCPRFSRAERVAIVLEQLIRVQVDADKLL